MAKKNGAQTVEVVPDRRVIVSAGVGTSTIDEIKWLTKTILEDAKNWKTTGWGYVADCSQLNPVTPEVGGELVKMTKAFVDAGCKAIGFAEGKSIMMKVQTKKNTERSETGVLEGHFATVEEAINWLKTEVKY